jgi:hypothetical protein
MTKFAINAQGKVLLSRDVLEHLGVHPGGKVIASKLPNGRIELKAAHRKGTIADVFGLLKRDGRRSLSIEQISKLAARGWAGK